MLTGPSIVNCLNSNDGFGQCLQTRLADAGLLPRPATPPVVADTAPDVTVSEAVADLEEAIAEPALDVTPPEAPVAVPDNLIAATFGLLRAEPDGSVVIAGSGTPGSEIEVFANGSLLGRATVETSGDWVLVPDEPLPVGPLEITLGEKGKSGQAEQSFVVVIHEDKKSQPLVVASTPGQASDILQGLDRPQTADIAQLADTAVQPEASAPQTAPGAEPADATAAGEEPVTQQPDASPSEPVGAGETAVATAEAPATPAAADAPAQTEEPAATAMAPAGEEAGVTATAADATVADTTAPGSAEEPAANVASAEVVPAPQAADAAGQDTPAEAPATPDTAAVAATQAGAADEPAADQPESLPGSQPEAQTQVAAVEQPVEPTTPAAPPVTPSSVAPTIDAIEIEGNRTFFAGAGPNGATVRLYVDNSFVADAQVEGGRWLVEAGSVLTKPSQRIRVDLLRPGSASVIGRAEVDFVVELPAGEEPTAIAANEASPSETVGTAAPAEAVVSPSQPAEPAATTADAPPVSSDATPSATSDTSAGATAPAATQPAAPQAAQAETPPSQPAQPGATAEPTGPAATPDAETPAVAQAPAEASETAPAIPTMVAVSFGGADAQRFAAGKAIIRRGDNLWTIARRVYGAGMKFTTIYEANTTQIRDPDWIYPGQVFELPDN